MSEETRKYRVPLFCPLCEFFMKGASTKSFYDWGVCSLCHIDFIEGREDRWKTGWRPTLEQIADARKV
jgi:hypothetical protein